MRLRLGFVCGLTMLIVPPACAQADSLSELIKRGNALDWAGNYSDASRVFRDAVKQAEEKQDARLPIALNALANVEEELANFADASRLYQRALTLASKQGKTTLVYALTLGNLGVHYTANGQSKKAEGMLRESLAVYQLVEPADSVNLALAKNALSNLLVDEARYTEAEELLLSSLDSYRRHPSTVFGQEAIVLNNLGVVRREQRRFDEARDLFEAAARLTESSLGANHPTLLRALNNVATVYGLTGHPAEADQAFRRSIAIAEERLGPEHPITARVLLNYAGFLRTTGRKAEAKRLEGKANTALRDNARTNGRGMSVDVSAFRR
jgi:tetratricopeptide (TPR) repeat protein